MEEKITKEANDLQAIERGNKLLRYNEKLYLNRQGYQPWAKSVTRDKRNHMIEGKLYGKGNGPIILNGPPVAHYTPSYNAVQRKLR